MIKKAKHEKIYEDVMRSTSLKDFTTMGELFDSVDAEYKRRVDTYGLKGYFDDDPAEKDPAIDKFFEEKFKQI